MSNFVYDNTPLNSTKVNRKPLPFGEDPNKWVQAVEDWNPAMDASLDLRGGVINNRFFGLQQQTTEPPVPTGAAPDFLWLDNAGILWAKINGISTNLLAGGGGGITGTLTNTFVPYATGVSTIADSAMSWDPGTDKLAGTAGLLIGSTPALESYLQLFVGGAAAFSASVNMILQSVSGIKALSNEVDGGSIPVFNIDTDVEWTTAPLFQVLTALSVRLSLLGNGEMYIYESTGTDPGGFRYDGSFMQVSHDGGSNWYNIPTDLQTAYDGGREILIAGFAPVELQINGILTGNVNPGLLLDDIDGGNVENDSPAVMFHCYEDTEGGPLDVYYEMHASGLPADAGSEFYIQVSDDTGGPWSTVAKWANNGDQTWYGNVIIPSDNSVLIGDATHNIANMYVYHLHNVGDIRTSYLFLGPENPYTPNTFQVEISGVQGTGGNGFGSGLKVSADFTQTTDATATTLHTYDLSILDDTVWWLEARVVGRKMDGSDNAFYIRQVKAKRAAGTITLSTIQTPVTDETDAAWDCTFVVSGSDVLLQVTGVAATNIDWECTVLSQFIWHHP